MNSLNGAAADLLPVRKIEDYEKAACIGGGGFAKVYEAVERCTNRKVALKLLKEDLAGSIPHRDWFSREAELAGLCQHPHVVDIHARGKTDEHPFFAMEHLGRESLRDEIEKLEKQESLYPPADQDAFVSNRRLAIHALIGACLGIEHVHRQKVLHLDIKPDNIMLARGGVIVDFGLGEKAGDTEMGGRPRGSLPYMSPEMASGLRPGDKTDVFGIGATLYHLLAMRTPYGGLSDGHFMQRIFCEFPPLEQKIIPRALRNLCRESMQYDPGMRPPCAAVRRQLEDVLSRSSHEPRFLGRRLPVFLSALLRR